MQAIARPRVLSTSIPQAALAPAADVLAADSQQLILSEPLPVDLVIYRGDTGAFRVTVTDSGGAPLDVSTATWDCDIRAAADGASAQGSLTVTPVAGQTNQVDVSLPAAVSAMLVPGAAVWDLEMTLAGRVTTLLAGDVEVIADVSRAL